MPSFTKQAILDAFLHIAAKKPLEKITVRDIVDECGVNRNTFYYYFQDIYAVLEELCRETVSAVPEGLSLGEVLERLYLQWSDFFEHHPRAMRNLAVSLGTDGADRYFSSELNDLLILALLRDEEGAALSADMQKLTVEFIRHAFIGVCINTLREKKMPEKEAFAARLGSLGAAMLKGLGLPCEKRGEVHLAEEERI